MDRQYEPIRRLLALVRARYRALTMCHAIVRAALAATAVVGLALAAASLASLAAQSPLFLAAAGAFAVVMALVAVAWGLMPIRHVPSDTRLARFIEERVPSLDDRLATAVDVVHAPPGRVSPILAAPLVADAARRAADVDVNDIVPRAQLQRSGVHAGAAALVLLILVIAAREPARQSLDAASLVLFPSRVRLDVRPGDARVKEGTSVAIEARISGNRAPVSAQIEIADGDGWRSSEMLAGRGAFHASLPSIASDVKYRVVVGSTVSPTYQIKVAYAPRVERIDVDYTYAAGSGLKPRSESDGGDLYAPAGTDVRLHVHADRPAAAGALSMSDGRSVPLASAASKELTATMKITADGAYRITLADPDGVTDGPQTEYFIRVLDDRPPEVHVVKPASDRPVTPLEEVEIEARADDDYGLKRVELVYAVRGEVEKVVPLDVPNGATSAVVHHTMYLEDLGVKPGDFVSYYVRARDIASAAAGPAAHSNEGRSDIFFLEVRPYEQEFALQQSQSMAGSGYSGSIDDLVNAQKQIVVSTWKIDRRAAANPKGGRSPQDVRTIGRSEAELKTRVEETASSLRESTMRDPRRRLQGRGGDAPDGPKIGQAMPEEEAMTKAVDAMGRAVASLDALNTTTALPPEMQALNALLEAQAQVKKRQLSRQQSAQGGPGNSNRNYDISTLFDRELQRLQETNYETRRPAERERPPDDIAEKIKELARRQDELLRRQEALARQQLGDEERRRQLETLTREQSQLRQQAEDMARQMSKLQAGLQEIADDMRSATGDLRRLDSAGSQARGGDALEKLKSLERQVRNGKQERRTAGDMQLEARQLADSQREMASSVSRTKNDDGGNQDRLRQLAGEQERLADRAQRLQDGARQNGSAPAADALARQRLAERMRQSAETLRKAAQNPKGMDSKRETAAEEQIARDLDRAADVLQPSADARDRDTSQLSNALARAKELREKLDAITSELQKPGAAGQRNQLRDQAMRELQRTRELIDELRRQDPSLSSGGPGLTFEGQGMTFSSPGTEGFKQDFARWQQLREQATAALGRIESAATKRLQDKQATDRLASGLDDKAPPAYRSKVDEYFKAIAAKKTP